MIDWELFFRGPMFVDRILRTHTQFGKQQSLSIPIILSAVVLFGLFYGAAMGSYAWIAGERSFVEQIPQIVFSAIKVPLLLGVTTVIALPSFFVFNSLVGLRDDFHIAVRAIMSIQAGLTIILASLAPFTIFVYYSATGNAAYQFSILFNSLMFGIASVAAQVLLRVYYRPLIARHRAHRRMLQVWIGLYAFIGIQCAWILRPFIGNPEKATTFFRKDKFGNAYVKVWELFCEVIGGVW